jgi:hypothetical protein
MNTIGISDHQDSISWRINWTMMVRYDGGTVQWYGTVRCDGGSSGQAEYLVKI